MSIRDDLAHDRLRAIFSTSTPERLKEQLNPHFEEVTNAFPAGKRMREHQLEKRWHAILSQYECDMESVLDPLTRESCNNYEANIENFIGTVKVPIGLAGPLRVNGLHAKGDFLVPLATTEAALVASYHRGSLAITDSGGCRAALLSEGVLRAPGFVFNDLVEVGNFLAWLLPQKETLKMIVEEVSNHGQLNDIQVAIEGNQVYLTLIYLTGDASGQNMVTIMTDHLLHYIIDSTPIKPQRYYVEANMSGDKKASMQSFQNVRGKKACAEIIIPSEVIRKRLRTTAQAMVEYWRISSMGSVMSGCFGIQGHYANGLAALYIACGQDAACVAESAIGITRMEIRNEGDLYATVTLPNLMLGTVGGGTGLPSQSACLQIMGLKGSGNAKAFAEVTASLILAGELSIIAALSAGHFSQAHKKLARDRKPTSSNK